MHAVPFAGLTLTTRMFEGSTRPIYLNRQLLAADGLVVREHGVTPDDLRALAGPSPVRGWMPKDLVARALHVLEVRNARPWVRVPVTIDLPTAGLEAANSFARLYTDGSLLVALPDGLCEVAGDPAVLYESAHVDETPAPDGFAKWLTNGQVAVRRVLDVPAVAEVQQVLTFTEWPASVAARLPAAPTSAPTLVPSARRRARPPRAVATA